MSDFLTRFETQLRATSPPRRRLDPRRALFAAVLAVALSGSALAATGIWTPVVGDSRRGHPSTSRDAPPQSQLDQLAILRRAATSGDHAALARKALRYFGADVAGVRIDYVRRLQVHRVSAVVVPVRRFHVGIVKRLGQNLTQAQREALRERSDGLCVFAPDPNGDGGGQTCLTTRQLRTGYIPGSVGPTIYGLVPDRVARVVLELDGGATLTATPRNNFFAVSASNREEDSSSPRSQLSAPAVRAVSWLDARGGVVAHVVRGAPSPR